MLTPLITMPGGMEWIVILVIVVIIFGAAKLPDLARSSGQALRIFKTETRALREEDAKSAEQLPQPSEDAAQRADERRDETS